MAGNKNGQSADGDGHLKATEDQRALDAKIADLLVGALLVEARPLAV